MSRRTQADLPQPVGPATTAVKGCCSLHDISKTNDDFVIVHVLLYKQKTENSHKFIYSSGVDDVHTPGSRYRLEGCNGLYRRETDRIC